MEANSSYQINDAPFNLHLGRMVKEYIEKKRWVLQEPVLAVD